MSIVFITRKNGFTLWSYGNYQYEISSGTSYSDRFEACFEDALDKFEKVAA